MSAKPILAELDLGIPVAVKKEGTHLKADYGHFATKKEYKTFVKHQCDLSKQKKNFDYQLGVERSRQTGTANRIRRQDEEIIRLKRLLKENNIKY